MRRTITNSVSYAALGLLSTGLFSQFAFAQESQIQVDPSEQLIERLEKKEVPPALQYLMDEGVKLTFLGDAGGMKGYLGESPSGKVQTFYLAPDGNHVVAGTLFRRGGVNVTGVQITDLKGRFDEAREKVQEASEAIAGATPENPVVDMPVEGMEQVTSEDIASGKTAMITAEDYLSERDAVAFKADVEKAAWFSVGAPEAPVVYMVADPQCPFCHQAWNELRPMVMERSVTVRVILIAGLEGSEPLAISILSRSEPARAWFAGEGSTDNMPVAPAPDKNSKEYAEGQTFLNSNTEFMQKYELDATPFLFVIGKDGKLYESRGWPQDKDAFFSAVKG